MFRVQHIQRNGVFHSHYWTHFQYHSNSLSSDQNVDSMQMLHHSEVDVPTHHFRVHKTVCILYSKVMFRVHYIWMHGLFLSHYCTHQIYLSNSLLSDPNRDRMQTLLPWEVDVPNYSFEDKTNVAISSSRVMFRVHYILMNGVETF